MYVCKYMDTIIYFYFSGDSLLKIFPSSCSLKLKLFDYDICFMCVSWLI